MPAKDYEYVLIIDRASQVKREEEEEEGYPSNLHSHQCPRRLLESKKSIML